MKPHNVEIYTRQGCMYSDNAKEYLQARKIEFKEIDIDQGDARDQMIKRAGGKTSTPQVFLDDKHIGGYDDMVQGGAFERFRQ
jgi:glutaredoxin 3